jgi:anthranilate synthase/aminodeoxychorismate synthase-like glutamine amidotransferase
LVEWESPDCLERLSGTPYVLVVDNYDSFTYNLVQYLTAAGAHCEVRFSDKLSVRDIQGLQPGGVLISPGPGSPDDAGVSLQLVEELGAFIPILGVCLGHQVLGQALGARIVPATAPVHGKTSPILHDGRGVFHGLPSPFEATRYHSLVVQEASLPACLEVSARSALGEVMGLRHRQLRLEGVQFHPESILTQHGAQLVRNWLSSL